MKYRAVRCFNRLWMIPLFLFLNCSLSGLNEGGNSSQTGNPCIDGILCNPDGSRAKSAIVKAVPADYNPTGQSAVSFDTITNDTGGYQFKSLPVGVYNVFCSGDKGLSYRDSVAVIKKGATESLKDSLKAPGSIRGVVQLLPGHDSRTVFIILMGTMTLSAPYDSIGNFRIANLAPGTYNVRLLSTLAYLPLDTQLTVFAGTDTVLQDTIRMNYSGIPVPTGLHATYDSLLQIVQLSWNKTEKTKGFKGFAVFRRNIDSISMVMINPQILAEILYRDSTGIQDQTYEYKIAAVDSNLTMGPRSAGVTVGIAGTLLQITNTIENGEGTEPGQFSGVAKGEFDSQGYIYVLDRGNNRLQKLDSAGNYAGFMIKGLSDPQGFAVGPGNTFFVADITPEKVNQIVRYDASNAEKRWDVRGKPRGLLWLSDTLYVIGDSGLAKYDSAGHTLDHVDYQFNFGFNGGDIALDADGKVYLSDGRNVYRFDRGSNAITPLYQMTEDEYFNQNLRIECLAGRFILLSTIGAKSPFNSSHYLIDLTGNLIGRWRGHEVISDVIVRNKTGSRALGLTANGKILSIACDGPAR